MNQKTIELGAIIQKIAETRRELAVLIKARNQIKKELSTESRKKIVSTDMRSRQCLSMALAGMTVPQIAKELTLTPETVKYYVSMGVWDEVTKEDRIPNKYGGTSVAHDYSFYDPKRQEFFKERLLHLFNGTRWILTEKEEA